MNLPPGFHVLYSEEAISKAVQALGREISLWAAQISEQAHSDVLAIPVLRGGIFFFADLVRQINCSVEIAPARAWAYDENLNVQRSDVALNIAEIPAAGRAVLLVDDICDSGRTLNALKKSMLQCGALTVKSAVLVKRMLAAETFEPDWVAFRYPGTEWLVGYGMDDGDRWRNLAAIHIIKQAAGSV